MAQYSCKWNSHAANMLNVMGTLRGVENFVDVTLVCEGRALKAHKLVLSTCSPFFHQIFLENPCPHPIVYITELKFATLKAIVDFIYKGEITFMETELEFLLKAAKILEIKGLTDVCREKLIAQAVDGQAVDEPGSKGPSSINAFRSPRKKRPRRNSGGIHAQFDSTSKEDDGDVMVEMGPRVVETHSERVAEDDESAKPLNEEPNVRIKQALRSLCSAKKMSLKEKQKITGDPLDRRTSFVWNFFTPVDNVFACCKTCNKNISRKSSISNLKKHLENKHSEIVLESFSSLVESSKEPEEDMEQEQEQMQKEEQGSISEEQESAQAVCTIEGIEDQVVLPYDGTHEQLIVFRQDPNHKTSMPILLKLTS